MTEPAVGASTWASGSQVWNGNIGILIAKARKNAPNARSWSSIGKPLDAAKARRASKSNAPVQVPVAPW